MRSSGIYISKNEKSSLEKVDLARFFKEDMPAYMSEIFFNISIYHLQWLFGISIDR